MYVLLAGQAPEGEHRPVGGGSYPSPTLTCRRPSDSGGLLRETALGWGASSSKGQAGQAALALIQAVACTVGGSWRLRLVLEALGVCGWETCVPHSSPSDALFPC